MATDHSIPPWFLIIILIMRLLIVPPVALIAVLLAACGSDSEDGSGGPTVSTTTGILADITEQVAGEDATVEQVIPDSASPHDFQLSAQDRAKIEDSVLLVNNGAALEAGVPVDEIDVSGFALTEHVPNLLPLEDAGEHDAGEHAPDEHVEGEADPEHGGVDPHVWMDPTRVAAALPALADALAEADPDHAAGYRSRAERYVAELAKVDTEVATALEVVPEQNRELVTSHDALGYFADRYGFEVVATPFPASGAEAEASAARIKEVEDVINDAQVPTVFAEEEDDPEVLELIADDTGVEVNEDLLVESPASAGSYVEMLLRDAQIVAEGLKTAPTGADT